MGKIGFGKPNLARESRLAGRALQTHAGKGRNVGMARKTRQEYESTRTTSVVSIRIPVAEAELFRERVEAAGGEACEYFVALLRSRSTPERDVRDLGRLTALIAALHDVSTKLARIRNEVARGFGLMKHTFIVQPILAARSKAELDRATNEAVRVIALAGRTVKAVEAELDGPLSDVRIAIQDLRAGKL